MKQPAYAMDRDSREAVLEALREVCSHRVWSLLAAHVRTNHVHVVVEADVKPEKVMNDFKSYASRGLNLMGDGSDRRRWARHGSTRWLWKDQDVREAIRYVAAEQGEPMAVFVADAP
jgi:REP element-mobilizing transposase RayT